MNPSKKLKILVAMSGGVDSSVTAAILKEQGYEVGGATIRTWAPNNCDDKNTRSCCGLSGVEDARDVAERIGIPYWVFNFENDFKTFVVDYFVSEYKKGRTPNPCIACNEHIKFKLFLKRARQMGYDAIATGHYACRGFDETRKSYYIAEGTDKHKDQSYVLFPLESEILEQVHLPLGHFTKTEIRARARELNLQSVMDKPDSQEICFIPSNDYGTFLEREYLGDKNNPGDIKTVDGQVVGRHEGYYHYTRGQRRGLGVAAKDRLYVVQTVPETNEVIVGAKEDVADRGFTVARMNWFLEPVSDQAFRAHVKIRAQHAKAPATVVAKGSQVEILFDESQDAITPGQGAVIYEGERILGGGWIESVNDSKRL